MEKFFNEKISLMFKLVVLNIEKNACVKGETIHNHVGDVTPDQLYAVIMSTDALGKLRLGK